MVLKTFTCCICKQRFELATAFATVCRNPQCRREYKARVDAKYRERHKRTDKQCLICGAQVYGNRKYCGSDECELERKRRWYTEQKAEKMFNRQKPKYYDFVADPSRWRGRGPSECPECRALEDRFRQADAADVLAIMAERYAHMEAAHGIPYRREVEQLEFKGVRP